MIVSILTIELVDFDLIVKDDEGQLTLIAKLLKSWFDLVNLNKTALAIPRGFRGNSLLMRKFSSHDAIGLTS